MTKKYRVLFNGLSGDKENFKSRMVSLGAPPEVVDKMIGKAPVILKEGLTLESSTRYAKAIRTAGGIAVVQGYGYSKKSINQPVPIASFKDFTMCPECGLKQQKGEACVKCGFRFVKMKNGMEPRNVAGH